MAKTSGLPLGLIWRDFATDWPAQPYPVGPTPCTIQNINTSGSRGVYRMTLDAGADVGVMRIVFNTGAYLLPGDVADGPARTVNSLGDRLVWSHGVYNNQDSGSSIGGNFYENLVTGTGDVPVITKDSENLTATSNLERVRQLGFIGGEKFYEKNVAGVGPRVIAISNLRGSIPSSLSHYGNLTGASTGAQFAQASDGTYLNVDLFDWDTTTNGFVNTTSTTGVRANVGPYAGWKDRNNPNFAKVTITPNMKTHDNTDDGDFFDLEDAWQSTGTLGLQLHSAGQANSVQQDEMYFPSFHANRNTTYCVPITPGNISSGIVTLTIEAPLYGTWFSIAYGCPIDMEIDDSGKHKLTRSAITTNWNQTCNTGNVNTTVYHMQVDVYGGVNPASVSRDENGIPLKTLNTYSPSLNNTNDHSGVPMNHRVVSEVRDSDGRDLWEDLVTTNYITRNGRGSWRGAMTGGTDPDTLIRDWYGMVDVVKCSGVFSFPANDQITCPTFQVETGAPSTASAVPEVGDLVVTATDNNFGNNGVAGNITVTAVNGQTITVSGMSMTTSAALSGLSPVMRFVRMGDIQTKGYLDPTLYNGSTTDPNDLTGQPAGDIGIRDYLFEDRYGTTPLPDGFYKIIDKNGVNNGNGGKKRVKVKDGIIIKCRNCFGSIKFRP